MFELRKTILTMSIAGLMVSGYVNADEEGRKKHHSAPTITIDIPVSTQGPLWPPAEVVDADGNFVVVGRLLKNIDGRVTAVNGAALVSPETIPPLNELGVEDFSNGFGSSYTIVKELDLSEGSPDLDIPLYTISYGPPQGDFGGTGGRVPMQGKSTYNLNSTGHLCPEVFPSSSQRFSYTTESVPIYEKKALGFQGDQVVYDVDTGIPMFEEENVVDKNPDGVVTLGRWLQARGKVKVTLADYDESQQAYTAAKFKFKFKKLIPNSVYTIWNIRKTVIFPSPEIERPDPIAMPNVIITDKHGNGEFQAKVENPFPATDDDPRGLRILAFAVQHHADFQNWGGCPQLKAPGVDSHNILNTAAQGRLNLTNFTTRSKI